MGPSGEQPTLGHGRVVLRPLRPGDAPAVHRACQDPAIALWTGVPQPYTAEDARIYVEEVGPAAWASGDGANYAITAAGDDELVGTISLMPLSPRCQVIELGYWVAPAARGRGLAAAATRLLAGWAIEELGMARVELYVDVGNAASMATAAAAGAVHEATLRARLGRRDGTRADAALWAFVAGATWA